MSSNNSASKQSTSKISNGKTPNEKRKNVDPLIMIDKIESQLNEISANLEKEENFYNNIQNSFTHNDIISIEPIENK